LYSQDSPLLQRQLLGNFVLLKDYILKPIIGYKQVFNQYNYLMGKNSFEDLIGLEEAAQYAGFSSRHLRLLLQKGSIRGKKIGRDWITTKEEIDKYSLQLRKPGRKRNTI